MLTAWLPPTLPLENAECLFKNRHIAEDGGTSPSPTACAVLRQWNMRKVSHLQLNMPGSSFNGQMLSSSPASHATVKTKTKKTHPMQAAEEQGVSCSPAAGYPTSLGPFHCPPPNAANWQLHGWCLRNCAPHSQNGMTCHSHAAWQVVWIGEWSI